MLFSSAIEFFLLKALIAANPREGIFPASVSNAAWYCLQIPSESTRATTWPYSALDTASTGFLSVRVAKTTLPADLIASAQRESSSGP